MCTFFFSFFLFAVWGLNPGPWSCKTNAVPLSYIDAFKNDSYFFSNLYINYYLKKLHILHSMFPPELNELVVSGEVVCLFVFTLPYSYSF